MSCSYCRWNGGAHDTACPQYVRDPREVRRRVASFRLGYISGHTGQEWGKGVALSQTWELGRTNAEIASEERSNGFNPVHEGRQW